MKKFILENWFKIIISIGLISFLVLAFLVYFDKKSDVLVPSQSNSTASVDSEPSRSDVVISETVTNEAPSISKEVIVGEVNNEQPKPVAKKEDITKADDYIVTYSDGKPIDWSGIDFASSILKETLETYQDTLLVIKEVAEKEKETINSLYDIIAQTNDEETKSQIRALLKYEEEYMTASDLLIGWLNDGVKKYKNLLAAATKRDAKLYLYYSDEISKIEKTKSKILNDYYDKQTAKQEFAKTMLTQ